MRLTADFNEYSHMQLEWDVGDIVETSLYGIEQQLLLIAAIDIDDPELPYLCTENLTFEWGRYDLVYRRLYPRREVSLWPEPEGLADHYPTITILPS